MDQKSTTKPNLDELNKNYDFSFYAIIIASIVGAVAIFCLIISFAHIFKCKCTSKSKAIVENNQRKIGDKTIGVQRAKSIPIIVNLPSLANSSVVTQISLQNQDQSPLIPDGENYLLPDIRQQQKSTSLNNKLSKSLKLSEYKPQELAGKIS